MTALKNNYKKQGECPLVLNHPMLLYDRVFDGAVNDVDFSVFWKKTCQVKFLKKLKYFHFHGLVGYGHRNYAALTL
jgi:hypothetical protein